MNDITEPVEIAEKECFDLVVIGAGAAGLMAAGRAAREGRTVLVIEKMEKGGRKIRITGKGRCNLTNVKPREEFLEKVRSGREFFETAFDRFNNQDVVDFFRRQKVDLDVERGDRVFPSSGKAWDIANALVKWAEISGAKVMYRTEAVDVKALGGVIYGVGIRTRNGYIRNIECRNVLIATGGASYPATGSTGDGYRMAHELGHTIIAVRPALVPLETNHPMVREMDGMQLKNVGAKLVVDGQVVREEFGELEFGSRGLEGAVILRVSRDAVDALIDDKKVKIVLDLKPALDKETILARIAREREALPPVARFAEVVRKLAPKQLVAPLCAAAGVLPDARMNKMDERKFEVLTDVLKNFELPVSDYRPFEEAVVTAGGVSVDEVDPATMASKLVKGLYFAGEVLDIDADTGGYNLQIAFSTGNLAAKLQ